MRFAAGARLGPFEILDLLGTGGTGEVYRARDTRLDRIVALKVLPHDLVSAPGRSIERFRLEARAIARITHPHICALHDLGEDDSTLYLVMEYVAGETLAQRLESGRLPEKAACRIAIGIADALDHAHKNGVTHRDLKPANVMLTRNGVKLLDFGLARLRDRDELARHDPTQSTRLTEDGSVVGTLPYMAPEQIEGGDQDARTDIFAFGVVLYEMVCGRRPFQGATRTALMAAIVGAEPELPASLQPTITRQMQRLILRCLAKDPDDRWQTARDLAAELRWVADGSLEEPAASVTSVRRRAGFLWGSVAGAVLTAVALVALAWWIWPRSSVAQYRPVTYRTGIVTAARFTPDGRSVVYSASWEGGPYRTFLGRLEGGDARDLELQESRILSVSRTEEMAVLFGAQNVEQVFGTRTLARIPIAGGARDDLLTGVVDADWIPGTDTMAVIRDPGGDQPWLVEFPAGTKVHETRAAWSLRVSPDGSRIAFFEGPIVFGSAPEATITTIDRSGRKTVLTRGWTAYGLAWTPSGQEVWFTATRPEQSAPSLHAVSLSGLERTVQRAPDWLVLHDISADGRVLLSRNSIRIGLVCKPRDAEREHDLTWLVSSAAKALSPDGQTVIFEDELLAASSGEPRILRRRADGSPAVPVGEGYGAALSPDGRWVLAASGGRLVLWPTGPGEMIRLSNGNLARLSDPGWFHDSKLVVFTGVGADGIPRGYEQNIPDGVPRAITPDHVALAGRAAARDEHSVLGHIDGSWMLFSREGGKGQPVPALTARDLPLQWSADGRYLYTVERADGERSPAVDMSRVDMTTGGRVLWKTLQPPDPVGVEDMRETVVVSPDGESYCYSYQQRLGDLFVVNGLI